MCVFSIGIKENSSTSSNMFCKLPSREREQILSPIATKPEGNFKNATLI